MQHLKSKLISIATADWIKRSIVFVIGWWLFAFVSAWVMGDVEGAIWYRVTSFLLYPLIGGGLIIEAILAYRGIRQGNRWKILGLYFLIQILCSPFSAALLIQLTRS